MKRLYTVFLCIILITSGKAQNRLAMLLDIREGDNYPAGMPHVKNWINTALDKVFIYDLQFSKSTREDAGFISFSIISSAPFTLVLPSTDSIRIPFGQAGKIRPGILSNNINFSYKDRMKAYIPGYSPANLKYTQEEYFLHGVTVSNFSDSQIVAHVLNNMIAWDIKTPVLKVFTDIINKKTKLKLPYAKEDSLKALLATFSDKQVDVKDAVFRAFFKDKDTRIFENKLTGLLGYKGIFRNNVMDELDEMRILEAAITFSKGEDLVFPSSIMADGVANAPARFSFTAAEAKLDYKKKNLRLTFKGKVVNTLILKKAKKEVFNFATRKDELHPADGERIDNFKEITLVIDENNVTGEAITDKEVKYIFMQNEIR